MSRGKLILLLMFIALIACLIAVWSGHHESPATQPIPTTTTAPAPSTVPATAPAPPKVLSSWMELLHDRLPRYTTTQPLDNRLKLSECLHLVVDRPVYLDVAGDLWITHPAAPSMPEVLAKATTQQVHLIRQPVLYVHWWFDDAGKRRATPICLSAQGQPVWIDFSGKPHPLPAGNYNWPSATSLDAWVSVPERARVRSFRWKNDSLEIQTLDFTQVIPPTSQPAGVVAAAGVTISPAAGDQPANPAASAASQAAPADPPVAPDPAILPDPASHNRLPVAVLLPDTRGLLAYLPADAHPAAGHDPAAQFHAARFVEDHWQPLAPSLWPDSILHLIPMTDGNVLQVRAATAPGQITLHWASLDQPAIPPDQLSQWLSEIASPDQQISFNAQQQLINHGRPILSQLEKMLPAQPPAVQEKLRPLIDNFLTPTLANMSIIGNRLRLVDRQPNGSVLFYAELGVVLPALDGSEAGQTLSPAWLLAQPGSTIRPVPMRLVRDRRPDTGHLQLIDNDWIAIDATGPRLFLGNELVYLTGPEDRSYTELLGTDRQGRWILRQSASRTAHPKTLIIDPFMPDNRPHMPIWKIATFGATSMGWDKRGYPGVQRGTSAWVLDQSDWRALNRDKDGPLYTDAPPATQPSLPPDPPASNGTSSASAASSTSADRAPSVASNSSASRAASTANLPEPAPIATTPPNPPAGTSSADAPSADVDAAAEEYVDTETDTADQEPVTLTERNYLLTDHAGRKYYGGLDQITIVFPDRPRVTTLLPPEAVGRLRPLLVEDAQGALYLFNESGRIVRLRLDLDSPDCFVVEATFTHRVPQGLIRHAWLDPCKRLCFVDDTRGELYVCFPEGHIPSPLSNLIPADLLDDPY